MFRIWDFHRQTRAQFLQSDALQNSSTMERNFQLGLIFLQSLWTVVELVSKNMFEQTPPVLKGERPSLISKHYSWVLVLYYQGKMRVRSLRRLWELWFGTDQMIERKFPSLKNSFSSICKRNDFFVMESCASYGTLIPLFYRFLMAQSSKDNIRLQ